MNIDNISVKQYKSRNDLVSNDYLSFLCDKIAKLTKSIPTNKLEKIDGALDNIPTFGDHKHLLQYNYNVKQLKQIAK